MKSTQTDVISVSNLCTVVSGVSLLCGTSSSLLCFSGLGQVGPVWGRSCLMYSGGSHRKHYPSSHWKIPLLLHVDEPKARMLILASPESYIYYFRFVILCRRELAWSTETMDFSKLVSRLTCSGKTQLNQAQHDIHKWLHLHLPMQNQCNCHPHAPGTQNLHKTLQAPSWHLSFRNVACLLMLFNYTTQCLIKPLHKTSTQITV